MINNTKVSVNGYRQDQNFSVPGGTLNDLNLKSLRPICRYFPDYLCIFKWRWSLRRSMELFSGMEDFCVHDCRRTGATHMAGLRISGEMLSRVLNHAKRGVTEQHYIKHSHDDEKRLSIRMHREH